MGSNGRGPQMTIEMIALIGFAFVATSLIAKIYERYQDVLYGPYIQGRNSQRPFEGAMDLLEQAIRTSGLRENFSRLGWKVRNVSYFASAIFC